MFTKTFIPFCSLFFCLLSCSPKYQDKKTNESTCAFTAEKQITSYTTAQNNNHFLKEIKERPFFKAKQPTENEISVFVNSGKQFQKFLGIGGAITDAAAETFAKLSLDKQEELLNAYYTSQGIGYSLLRTTIHSCDFSNESYTYIKEGDKELATFSINHDKRYRLPMIKRAIDKAGGKLITYASPWSPPAFMKGKTTMTKGGKLLPEFYQAWANYYVKFINAYEKEGVPIWGLTIQNEPMAVQKWESCIYTAEEERDFLKNYLGPTLEQNNMADKKIIVWDHNRDLISYRANTILEDPEARKYVWGIGFHWYETWTGADPKWENIEYLNKAFPDKNLLFTEGCNEKFDENDYQRWSNAERYGESMINDFNNGTVGWTDWNILLNQNGGPNHVGNYCFAPIHADTRTNELIYTPSYFYIGHFSKFIRPGAVNVATTTSRSTILATSFLNKNGRMITVILNKTDDEITYNFIIDQTNETKITIPAHAIQTLTY